MGKDEPTWSQPLFCWCGVPNRLAVPIWAWMGKWKKWRNTSKQIPIWFCYRKVPLHPRMEIRNRILLFQSALKVNEHFNLRLACENVTLNHLCREFHQCCDPGCPMEKGCPNNSPNKFYASLMCSSSTVCMLRMCSEDSSKLLRSPRTKTLRRRLMRRDAGSVGRRNSLRFPRRSWRFRNWSCLRFPLGGGSLSFSTSRVSSVPQTQRPSRSSYSRHNRVYLCICRMHKYT